MNSTMATKTKEDVYKFVQMTSEHKNWKLHPDEMFLDVLVEGLMINYNRYGYFSCPCRSAAGERTKDQDIICPCAYCVPDQEEFGHCYCGLYSTLEFAENGGGIPKPIPERRPEEMDT
jgi:ferredoxin-thioredoxin reductase catalytic chain